MHTPSLLDYIKFLIRQGYKYIGKSSTKPFCEGVALAMAITQLRP